MRETADGSRGDAALTADIGDSSQNGGGCFASHNRGLAPSNSDHERGARSQEVPAHSQHQSDERELWHTLPHGWTSSVSHFSGLNQAGLLHAGTTEAFASFADLHENLQAHRSRPVQQFVHRLADVGRSHQGLTHQHRVCAARFQSINITASLDAALADQQRGRCESRCEAQCVIKIDDKCAEVTIVDADQRRIELEDTVEILGILDFDERLHPEFTGVIVKVAQVAVIQALGDQQDAVGSRGTGLDHLITINDEVLSQDGDRHGLSHGPQKIEMPLKEVFVCQNAETRGAMSLVGERNLHGIEISPDDPSGRRRLLDLGNQRHVGLGPQRRHKIANRGSGSELLVK